MTGGREVQRLRVVVVAPPYYEVPPSGYGGVERVCALLVDGLAARGHDVTLVATGDQHTAGGFVQTLPVAPGEGTDDVAVEVLHAARARDAVEALRPDVVHHHGRAGLLTLRGHPPAVATVHYAVAGPESQAPVYRALGGRVPLVALSDAQRDRAPDLAWTGRVHNGVDPAEYRYRAAKDDFLLHLGRLSATKGVDRAVAAARAAGRRLVVAGAATIPAEQRWVDAVLRDRADGVEYVGEVSGARRVDLLSRAACLLHLAQWEEPFGLDVVEAMACGTPVVATRRGALPELVADGVTGALCDDTATLSDAIERAAGCSPAACRARVLARFTADRMVEAYVEVYRRLVG